MSQFLLDTNTWIAYFRNSSEKVVANIKSCDVGDILLCSIVYFELTYGVIRSSEPYRQARAEQLAEIHALHKCIPFNDAAGAIAAEIRSHLAFLGTPIGPYDLLIAATAMANDLTVVTSNTKEFSRVPNLV